LSDRLTDSDTIANRAALADECLKVARFDEAERHYDHILTLPMGDDPKFAVGKAQAQFAAKRAADALATLDDLQKRWPDFQSAEGHLLYAARWPRLGGSMRRWRNIMRSRPIFPGAEARVRYGLLLRMVGRTAEARIVFNELLLQMKRAPKYLRDAYAEWPAIAEKQLSA